MGQKVNPIGLRIGIIREWPSQWFSDRNYTDWVLEDIKIRDLIKKKFKAAGIPRIDIERKLNMVIVTVYAARPGMLIGHRGRTVEQLRKSLEELAKDKEVHLHVREVEKPELEAQLLAESVVQQIERRVAHKRAMRQAALRALSGGALGIKIIVAGRLGGAELARDEKLHIGRVPLNTFRADIDYGFDEAWTKWGRIGVHVWLYRGDILTKGQERVLLTTRKEPVRIVAVSSEEAETEELESQEG
ncbi:MAG: 30S ribosomal protein S3 [Armatimonadetes bacterium]|nr:30S ribosomal protein S3 [Armatimonadota bacterium]MDW8121165.1 30S ribosomal protein S3 [Armatimonadota bacterium]